MKSRYAIPSLAALFLAACAPQTGSVPASNSEKQMLGLIEKFDRWDYNGNGLLSSKEIDDGLESLKGTSRAVSYTSAEVVKFYDRNADKSVSLYEAQKGYKNTIEGGAAPLR